MSSRCRSVSAMGFPSEVGYSTMVAIGLASLMILAAAWRFLAPRRGIDGRWIRPGQGWHSGRGGSRRGRRGGRGGDGVETECGDAQMNLLQSALIFGVLGRVMALGCQGLAADEQGLDVGRRLEDVAGGDHQVGALAHLE